MPSFVGHGTFIFKQCKSMFEAKWHLKMFYGKHKKIRITLFIVSLLVLVGSLVLSTCLLFSNYRNVQLLQRAESDFQRGDAASLKSAETQLLQLIRNDGDNEQAFVLLGKIAALNKIYPEMVYYTYQAHRLNPLSNGNEQVYIQSLLFSRDFQKLEIFLSQKHALDAENTSYLLYAAGQNGTLVKYRQQFDETKENASHLNRLTHLLYAEPGSESVERDLLALKKDIPQADGFLVQEVSAALANVYLSKRDFDQAERFLLESYKLNESAFAPVLGRFYSNYRSMGKAAEIYEKYLSVYHDPIVALDYGELCCLLKNKAKLVFCNI